MDPDESHVEHSLDDSTDQAALVRPATIYDVAAAAGVSHQTVSRLMRGHQGIRPVTRDKVRQAMRELKYRPNAAARALKSGRSSRMAVLTQEVNQYGPASIIRGATIAAREAGYMLDVISLDASSAQEVEAALQSHDLQDVAAIIGLASTDELSAVLDETPIAQPVVRVEEHDDTDGTPSSANSAFEIPTLTNHLIDLGHRDFLHIAGPKNWAASRNRQRAVERALDARGMTPPKVIHADWTAASGYRSISAGLPSETTAVVAANDQMALGAMLALHELGLRVPDDVSVTGMDDVPDAAFFWPPLTTIRIDFEQHGRRAIARALDRLGSPSDAPMPRISNEVVFRSSTATARLPRSKF